MKKMVFLGLTCTTAFESQSPFSKVNADFEYGSSLLYPGWFQKLSVGIAFFSPVSVAPVISSPNDTIVSCVVRGNGTPVVNYSNETVYSYNAALFTWVKISDRWWSEGSDVWQGRHRFQSQVANRGIVAFVEGTLSGPPSQALETPWSECWNTTLTLCHLETQLHAAKLLDSPVEY
ncbi:TUP1-like enhancer of split-domain-containing protein [Lentinula edodes]|uniref:TUP1-like enhancer of split-domain-containing protein n=1 Tax=Lentinula edodes TaxID=5353 RepID=UPI001E8D8938|nr:TUP1-like enhancer of split-domain-containing protein [Lentinula edodes]KAH7868258.1 TUP1-like enhancer of split-domain-containing protein [Lentinula edodes]